ncbi:MAG: DUF839 domain-containing protein [Wenzhouxiangellaceae bacterium]|nr:DUF839 domain-containing protein [Wenzhouxiangellaceae bacterium]
MSVRKIVLSVAVSAALAQTALAGTPPYFNPLTQSSAVATPNQINELTGPWVTPAGISQINITSMAEIEAAADQSVQRVPAGNISSMWDMIAADPSGRYLFIPHETPFGAGMTRFDRVEKKAELMFAGDQQAAEFPECDADALEPRRETEACAGWDFDYGAFDPARWTPNGTVWLGEEWTALGRIVEIMDPLGPAPENPTARPELLDTYYREIQTIANVAHEGVFFSKKFHNQVIYYIDEWNSGSIYALVLNRPGDYTGGGQTFVLRVDDFLASGGDPAANWNEGPNRTASRHGLATWVPLTDPLGRPLPGVPDPFRDGPTNDPRTNDDTRGGRVAADAVGGTPYGRPEDSVIGLLPNFNEVLYVTVTSEAAVISIEMLGNGKAMVREFASEANTPKNVGFPSTTGRLNSPDNLEIDALGNVYIIEDSPNSGDVGGDIWFARDVDSDGVAESLDHFLSLQVAGSESTGMLFDPVDPTTFFVAIQHPTSTDLEIVPDGMGDALWEFNIAGAVPPPCGAVNPIQACNGLGNAGILSFDNQLERVNRERKQRARFQPRVEQSLVPATGARAALLQNR